MDVTLLVVMLVTPVSTSDHQEDKVNQVKYRRLNYLQ
jgi:hypothetical protein